MHIIKKFVFCLIFAVFICCLAACDAGNDVEQTAKKEDPHIVFVKEGSPVSYPDKTYGDAFDAFFASPSWKYFKGSDDNSDESYDVVEFTGYCTYQDVQVQACLQFTLDVDDSSFEATYLSFNDVPQNMLMLAALIEAAITNEDLDTAASLPSEPFDSEPTAETTQPVDVEQLYRPILEKYATAMIQGYDRGQLQDAGLNLLCAFHHDLSEIGYTYLDVNRDGCEELLIGEYPAGQIYDLYTLIDGKPKLVFQSGERTIYTICTNGSVACSGSNSASAYSDCYYTMEPNGELHLSEAIIIDSEINDDICFYSTASESAEDAEPITFAAADQIRRQYTDLDITFTSMDTSNDSLTFSDPKPNTSANDSLPAVSIDTSYPYGYYEKDGGGAMGIGYTTDESDLLYFEFYKDRNEGMYGAGWQEPDLTVNFDFFDLGESSSWSLTMDGVLVDVSFDSSAMMVTAYGSIGELSAEQISGTYYCKQQAVGW